MNTAKGATEVLRRTSDYLQSGLLTKEPSWYKVLAFHPPKYNQIKALRREVLEDIKKDELSQLPDSSVKNGDFFITRIKTTHFKGDLIKPKQLKFIEDELRNLFYKQHPWELADPKSLIENENTIDLGKLDWSRLRQFHKKLDGESVVQRALYIAKNSEMPLLEAYEEAKFEYYRLKIQDEAEMNITREESEMFGAVYGQSLVDFGFEKEMKVLNKWKKDAIQQTQLLQAKITSANSGGYSEDGEGADNEDTGAALTEEDLLGGGVSGDQSKA